MYCRVIACDFDGTGAIDGRLAPEVADALHRARARGITTLLVTGRVLDDLRVALVDLSAFDAIVGENGALIWFPALDRTVQLGSPPPEAFLGRLRAAGIPFHTGAVVIGTWEGHAAQALALIRETGVDLQVVFNRAAVMLLPSGVNKATGVRRALLELGRSPRNMIAFGDAENDLPLFELAEVAVAARGAVPAVAAVADERLVHSGAVGVAHYIERLLEHQAVAPTPARVQVVIGATDDGRPALLRASGGNVLISGDARSGKSWLAGLVVERLLERGYRICIIDPEGDYEALAERPDLILFGSTLALPAPADVPGVLRATRSSLVLSLAGLAQSEKCRWVCTAVEALGRERLATGLPQWTLIDEAHYFFREGGECCAGLLGSTGNLVLVTYRPSLLAPRVYETLDACLIRRTQADEERYFMEGLLAAHGPTTLHPADALADLGGARAGLLTRTPNGPRWDVFTPGARWSGHVHHARKYVDEVLPWEKAFGFRRPDGRIVRSVTTVRAFAEAVAEVPIESLRHHLTTRDFSRWAREVLGDAGLAAGFAKLENTTAIGGNPNRNDLLDHLRDHYSL